MKRVYVRVRDVAGNISFIRSSLITYIKRPILTTATTASLPSVNSDYFRIEGENLLGCRRSTSPGRTITTKWNSLHDSAWVNGYFRVFGSTAIRFYPPQGLTPGVYEFEVENVVGKSNKVQLTVTANKSRIIRSANKMLVNGLQSIIVTRGISATGSRRSSWSARATSPRSCPGSSASISEQLHELLPVPAAAVRQRRPGEGSLPGDSGDVEPYGALPGWLPGSVSPIWPMPTSDVWTTSYVQ